MATWLLLSIFSALFLGLYDVAKKRSVDANAVLPVLFACSLAGVGLLLPAGGIVERGISEGSVSAALETKAVVQDAVVGGAFGVGGKLAGGLVKAGKEGVSKIAGGVKARMGASPREAAKGCGNACRTPGGCFVAGTLVLLASGALLPIEQIQVGDQVVAPASLESPREYAPYEVLETPRRTVAEVLDVLLEHEDGRRELLTTTDEHPFAVERESGTEWVVARELRAGDRVVADAGVATVQSVARRVAPTEVFNLVVESAHAYLVGDGVLVHNGDGYGPAPGKTSSRAARREAMRQQGIPTSQQPLAQSQNASGRSFEYEVPKPGGGTQIKSVQQQTMDRSHPDQGHWEAGTVKTDPITGETRTNQFGRPKLTNDKSMVDYSD